MSACSRMKQKKDDVSLNTTILELDEHRAPTLRVEDILDRHRDSEQRTPLGMGNGVQACRFVTDTPFIQVHPCCDFVVTSLDPLEKRLSVVLNECPTVVCFCSGLPGGKR